MFRPRFPGLRFLAMAFVAAGATAWTGSAAAAVATDGASRDAAPKVATVDHAAPDFTLTGADGKSYTLSEFQGKHVVLEWVNFGCPFVRKHYDSGNMQSLQSTWTDSGVVWLSISSSAEGKQGWYEGEALQAQLQKEGSHATAYLIDADGTVGKAYGARTTPHMYVIDPEGRLVYAGGIDNIHSADPADIARATNYVDEALECCFTGVEEFTKTSQPYGCSVKYAN